MQKTKVQHFLIWFALIAFTAVNPFFLSTNLAQTCVSQENIFEGLETSFTQCGNTLVDTFFGVTNRQSDFCRKIDNFVDENGNTLTETYDYHSDADGFVRFIPMVIFEYNLAEEPYYRGSYFGCWPYTGSQDFDPDTADSADATWTAIIVDPDGAHFHVHNIGGYVQDQVRLVDTNNQPIEGVQLYIHPGILTVNPEPHLISYAISNPMYIQVLGIDNVWYTIAQVGLQSDYSEPTNLTPTSDGYNDGWRVFDEEFITTNATLLSLDPTVVSEWNWNILNNTRR